MRMFHQLCEPLKDAWVWRTIRQHTQDIYEKEIKELLAMWDALQQCDLRQGEAFRLAETSRRQLLGIFAILYENSNNEVAVSLLSDPKHQRDWDAYIATFKEFIRKEPDTSLYMKQKRPYKKRIFLR